MVGISKKLIIIIIIIISFIITLCLNYFQYNNINKRYNIIQNNILKPIEVFCYHDRNESNEFVMVYTLYSNGFIVEEKLNDSNNTSWNKKVKVLDKPAYKVALASMKIVSDIQLESIKDLDKTDLLIYEGREYVLDNDYINVEASEKTEEEWDKYTYIVCKKRLEVVLEERK